MCECQGNPLTRVTLALGLPYLLVNRALVARFIIAMLTKQYASSKQHSMGPRTRRILVDFTKIFVISVPFYKCAQCFSFFLPKFSQALQNFKSAVVCLRAGQTFVKRQNCQLFQVAGVNLAESSCQVNLISLFKSLFRQKPVKIFDPCIHYCICCF